MVIPPTFSFILGSILPAILVAEAGNAATVPYDAVELERVEEKAKSIDLDDTSAILDVVHDDTRKLTAAAHSDRILGEARADLWRKKKDKEEQMFFASDAAERNAEEETKRARAEAERARSAMAKAARKKVFAENRIAAADDRVDDADVHIEEAIAKKEAAKIVMSKGLARMRSYHSPPSDASAARIAVQDKRADAQEREEEAMAFVRADKDVKSKDNYKVSTVAQSESKMPAGLAEEEDDQKEAQSEIALAKQSAAKKVRGMLEDAS
eukprot:gnl/MRDRNA2_/MRDRNA2_97828_c0_seq1.p1 gnl/MRDRNA2_/MRDRNA2_97828_c0~~gnl/MRDRNA2_/MRDRNA2_97828_c0_seq1.p1  ORF type:complete len:268 (+),score=86.23 gnl/MRDRNA2_/MRDRNA2_97828_c0_seq1:87-890(+)